MRKLAFLAFPLILMACGEAPPQPQPRSLVLFEGQSQYEARPESEVVIQGVLSFNPNQPVAPSEITSRYSLKVSGKFYFFNDLREKEKELNLFVGKNIYVKGKIVDIHINDVNWPNLVWPAIISVDAEGL
jgi:hypothetical protein